MSPFYKTLDKKDFFIFKDNRNLILQSPNLAKIHLEHGAIVFCVAIFSSCPSFAYQLFITRVFSLQTNSYYTTSFSIMSGKTIADNTKIFLELDKNINKNTY